MKKILILFLCLFSTASFATGVGVGSPTAPCTNNTLNQYSGTVGAEIDWEPNTIQLNWYDGDTKLNVANTSQSCVYDGTITVPPQPTKPGYTFNGWKVKKILTPSGYTQLQYIESSGTQYINTGYSPNSNTRVEIKAQKTSNELFMLFGALDNVNDNRLYVQYSLYSYPQDNSKKFMYTFGRLPESRDNDISSKVLNTNFIDYTFSTEKNTLIINDTAYTSGELLTFSINSPIYLWARNGEGTATYISAGRIYYVKFFDNGTLMREMVPARRNSDNVVGMYDTVTQTFFTNAGTGTFIAGPAVQ